MAFFSNRSKLDKALDQFYQNIGLEQGPLQDILHFTLEILDKEKQQDGYLSKKEQALLVKVQDKQRALEQLKKDVDAIEVLDTKADEALEVVLQQINMCNKYEQQAWENFKNIARELNDKEARKQYYDTKGLLSDIEKINTYLTGSFSQYFNQTIQSAQDHMKSIAAQMSTLKNDGVDLKKEAEKLEEDDIEEEKEKKESEKKEPKKVVKKTGILNTVTGWFSSITQTVKGWWTTLYLKVFSIFSKETKDSKKTEDSKDKKTSDKKNDTEKKDLDDVKKTDSTDKPPVVEDKMKDIFGDNDTDSHSSKAVSAEHSDMSHEETNLSTKTTTTPHTKTQKTNTSTSDLEGQKHKDEAGFAGVKVDK